MTKYKHAAIGLIIGFLIGFSLSTYKLKECQEQNEIIKKKSNPKQFDGIESDEPFVKTRKKSTTKKVK